MPEYEAVVELAVQPQQAGQTLGVFLRRCGVSLSVVRGLKQQPDGLELNGCRVRTDTRLAAGDVVRLNLPAADGFSAEPQRLPLEVVYQSADALVVNKPAGMPVHPGPGIHGGTLANAVCGYYAAHGTGGVFRPVGRLDAGTSGLVLCARHAAAAHKLAAGVRKVYLALVGGRLARGGEIKAPLAPQKGSAVRQQVCAGGRPSHTEFAVLAAGQGMSLVRVIIHTGRTHQIRAHFAHIGHPLLGDALYGGDGRIIRRQALHCAGLCFEELQGNCPCLFSTLPQDMLAVAAAGGLDEALPEAAQTLF